jgi:hypothetical protein
MKDSKVLFIVLCLLFLFGCEEAKKNPTAQAVITSHTQTYYDTSETWGMVRINYTLTNTGDVLIDYFKINFLLTCTDDSEILDFANGVGVEAGADSSSFTMVETNGIQVSTITVSNIELTSY